MLRRIAVLTILWSLCVAAGRLDAGFPAIFRHAPCVKGASSPACCPDDYCAKPCPPAPCFAPFGCCDKYCKPFPCLPCPAAIGCCDDYVRKCCPIDLHSLCLPCNPCRTRCEQLGACREACCK